jgi:hypothetical protein
MRYLLGSPTSMLFGDGYRPLRISFHIKKQDTFLGALLLVEIRGFEPLASALRTQRSTN